MYSRFESLHRLWACVLTAFPPSSRVDISNVMDRGLCFQLLRCQDGMFLICVPVVQSLYRGIMERATAECVVPVVALVCFRELFVDITFTSTHNVCAVTHTSKSGLTAARLVVLCASSG